MFSIGVLITEVQSNTAYECLHCLLYEHLPHVYLIKSGEHGVDILCLFQSLCNSLSHT